MLVVNGILLQRQIGDTWKNVCIKFKHPKPLQKKVMAQNVKKKKFKIYPLSMEHCMSPLYYKYYSEKRCFQFVSNPKRITIVDFTNALLISNERLHAHVSPPKYHMIKLTGTNVSIQFGIKSISHYFSEHVERNPFLRSQCTLFTRACRKYSMSQLKSHMSKLSQHYLCISTPIAHHG